MIPRHCPPFGLLDLATAAVPWQHAPSVEELERRYAETLGVRHAIWTPSGRAAIAWALETVIEPGLPVVCPAFTCRVVHEAIRRASGRLVPVDVASRGFLMDTGQLATATAADHALVLCDIFGHSYDRDSVDRSAQQPPRIRIWDLAMSAPDPKLLRRLHGNDAAVLSFGLGKCLYSGWGGLLLTNDGDLAESVRSVVDQRIHDASRRTSTARCLTIAARTLAHLGPVYGMSRALSEWFRGKQSNPKDETPSAVTDSEPHGPEWSSGSAAVDRQLAIVNLNRLDADRRRRVAVEAGYRRALAGLPDIICPPESDAALSHFSILVPSAIRDGLRDYLRRSGIDTGTLFQNRLDDVAYPRSRQLTERVVNLPLHPSLTSEDVERIAGAVHAVASRDSWTRPSAVRSRRPAA